MIGMASRWKVYMPLLRTLPLQLRLGKDLKLQQRLRREYDVVSLLTVLMRSRTARPNTTAIFVIRLLIRRCVALCLRHRVLLLMSLGLGCW
jgi:hypothetical protein